jgi:hypothetical protein
MSFPKTRVESVPHSEVVEQAATIAKKNMTSA